MALVTGPFLGRIASLIGLGLQVSLFAFNFSCQTHYISYSSKIYGFQFLHLSSTTHNDLSTKFLFYFIVGLQEKWWCIINHLCFLIFQIIDIFLNYHTYSKQLN